jgi:hypothetical protein
VGDKTFLNNASITEKPQTTADLLRYMKHIATAPENAWGRKTLKTEAKRLLLFLTRAIFINYILVHPTSKLA